MICWFTHCKLPLAQVPTLDPKLIEDAIVGCAFPEAEQGLNVARMSVLLAGLPRSVGGVTVNRYVRFRHYGCCYGS
jgi:acetyl-CoA acyltransferase